LKKKGFKPKVDCPITNSLSNYEPSSATTH